MKYARNTGPSVHHGGHRLCTKRSHAADVGDGVDAELLLDVDADGGMSIELPIEAVTGDGGGAENDDTSEEPMVDANKFAVDAGGDVD